MVQEKNVSWLQKIFSRGKNASPEVDPVDCILLIPTKGNAALREAVQNVLELYSLKEWDTLQNDLNDSVMVPVYQHNTDNVLELTYAFDEAEIIWQIQSIH